jgi:hypothetical protein
MRTVLARVVIFDDPDMLPGRALPVATLLATPLHLAHQLALPSIFDKR